MFDAAKSLRELGTPIHHLSDDSRDIRGDCAFVAMTGDADDGRRYIADAIAAGATAVLWESARPILRAEAREAFRWREEWDIPNLPVDDLRAHVGNFADAVYEQPSRRIPVIAVTGTNGKTTISHFVAQLLEAGGLATGVIGTLGGGRLGNLQAQENTTPSAVAIHQLLRRFIADGCEAAVLEASSHGIAQGRVNGLRLAVAVFANAGYDHLDYHGDYESYWASKAKLFELPGLRCGIFNADDSYCAKLARALPSALKTMTYGEGGEALRLLEMAERDGGFALTVDGVYGRRIFSLPFCGRHNVDNFLAAALVAHVVGVHAEVVAAAASTLTLPPGRLQEVSDRPGPAVYVDYAHTPDAMRAVLSAMSRPPGQPGRPGKLAVVFGCGGERDRDKRAKMGAIAAELAARVYVTDDNPRDEDAAAIRREICKAAPQAKNIADRRAAIAAALADAEADDTVLILGKGHEQTQLVNERRLSFSDAEVARQCLAELKDAGR